MPDSPAMAPLAAPSSAERRRMLAAWYLCRGHRALWHVPLTVALAIFLVLLMLRGTSDDPRAHLAQSRAEVLALAPPEVPKAENAAENYRLAQAAKVRYAGPSEHDPSIIIGKESLHFEAPEVQAFFNANAKAIQHLYAGAAKARCNWGLNYSLGNGMMPNHLGQMRDSARLLAAHARACAHAGDHRESVKALTTIYKMARHVEVDPMLYNTLYASAMYGIADGAMQAIVRWDTPLAFEDLAVYRKAVCQDRRPLELSVATLKAEKALFIMDLDALYSQQAGAAAFWSLQLGPLDQVGMPWYGGERRCLSAVMDEMIEAASRGDYEKFDGEKDLLAAMQRHQTGPLLLAPMLLPALGRSAISFYRSTEQGIVTDTGLAWLQFRARHDRDPKSLKELVPEFLKEIPRGFFNSEPLRMRIDPRGIVERESKTGKETRPLPGVIRIYSLGQNGEDDNGHSDWDGEVLPWQENMGTERPARTPDDAVFRIPPMEKPASSPNQVPQP